MENNFQDSAVVLINYNSVKFLPTVFNYLDELIGRLEIYVIDDKSNDGSIEELKKRYKDKIRFVINEKNSGAAYSRNRALKNISKRYLLFLDPDIKISSVSILSLFNEYEAGDIVFPRIEYLDGRLCNPINEFEKKRCTNSAVFLINREKVKATQQYFDQEMFIYVEDNDVFSRWWAFGLKFYYAENIVAYHPVKSSYSEELFFYRVRNPFIMFIKQAGIIPFRFNPFIWITAYTGLNFLAAVFNRNFSVAAGGFEKVKVTNRQGVVAPRLILISLFFKAIARVVINLGKIISKRQDLKKQLNIFSAKKDQKDDLTAEAFAKSWNNLPLGSIYTQEQFEEWLEPITKKDVEGKKILDLGCGNGSMMMRMTIWNPGYLVGVDLGESVISAERNMRSLSFENWNIVKEDLVKYRIGGFDFVYCIGVLHHLKHPERGFESVINNTKKGGSFHCWVYAREGNNLIIYFVDPLRKIVHKLPWWVIKYLFAAPLVLPFYFYAKLLNKFSKYSFLQKMPLYKYSIWIAKREFKFFWHVAFDQLVTPETKYIEKKTVKEWLYKYPEIDKKSIYIIQRNEISWKFGGKIII